MEQIKMADATLAEYELFAVPDNWIDERLQLQEMEPINFTAAGFETDNNDDDAIDENEIDKTPNNLVEDGTTNQEQRKEQALDPSRMQVDEEPWDFFGEDSSTVDDERRNVMKVPFPPKGTFLNCVVGDIIWDR
jgi:hypothetical protein